MIIEKKIINNIKQKTKSKCGGCCGDTILTPTPSGSGGGTTPMPTVTITPIPTSPTPTPSLTVSPSPTPSSSSGETPIPTPNPTQIISPCNTCGGAYLPRYTNTSVISKTFIVDKTFKFTTTNFLPSECSVNGKDIRISYVYPSVLFYNTRYSLYKTTTLNYYNFDFDGTSYSNDTSMLDLGVLMRYRGTCDYCTSFNDWNIIQNYSTIKRCTSDYVAGLYEYGENFAGSRLKTNLFYMDTSSVLDVTKTKITYNIKHDDRIIRTFDDHATLYNVQRYHMNMVTKLRLSDGSISYGTMYIVFNGDNTASPRP